MVNLSISRKKKRRLFLSYAIKILPHSRVAVNSHTDIMVSPWLHQRAGESMSYGATAADYLVRSMRPEFSPNVKKRFNIPGRIPASWNTVVTVRDGKVLILQGYMGGASLRYLERFLRHSDSQSLTCRFRLLSQCFAHI